MSETNAIDQCRFRLIRPLAQGAYSLVHLALDVEINRIVALKELRQEYALDPSANRRLMFEAEVTGGLEHPGVIPVYGSGRHGDGRAYFTMRLVRGEDLQHAIGRLSSLSDPSDHQSRQRRLMERFVDVCYTIDYAHGRGVIHRDLSPRNILLGQFGETVVIDWGLAKWIGPTPSEESADSEPGSIWPATLRTIPGTKSGHAMGTPCYLSPEQAGGRPDLHGAVSDVYSLGAILYQILTGKAPFEGASDMVFQQAQVGDFPPPRQIREDLDPALEAICLKAMALEPEDRHQRAIDLGDDVVHWMENEGAAELRDSLAIQEILST